jgi:hypothetical protein
MLVAKLTVRMRRYREEGASFRIFLPFSSPQKVTLINNFIHYYLFYVLKYPIFA